MIEPGAEHGRGAAVVLSRTEHGDRVCGLRLVEFGKVTDLAIDPAEPPGDEDQQGDQE